MLLLDKTKETNEIVVTIIENLNTYTPSLGLVLYSPESKVTHEIALGENQSLFPERYDSFIIPKADFIDFNDGYYIYQIYHDTDLLLETGYLKIISDKKTVEYVAIKPQETDDDFIVYQS